jgi:hypothetical protein
MRGMIFLGAFLLGLGAQAAGAPDPAPAPAPAKARTEAPESASFWTVTLDRLTFAPARLSVPRHAGTVDHYETKEFSHPGEGIDSALQLRSPDRAVFASVYVYLPSLAHTGLQAIATDVAIRANPKGGGVPIRTGLASVGGKPGLALTAAYRNYMGQLFTTSAFVKAGRWLVKVRVSGPEAREAEVSAALAALLDGLRFEGAVQPRPAAPLEVSECGPETGGDARLLQGKDMGIEGALVASLDAAGEPAADRGKAAKPLPPRIGRTWCRSVLEVEGNPLTVLRATGDGRGDGLGGRSELFVLYSDAGGMLEVVGLDGAKKHLLLNHAIGETDILGTFDAVPSMRQLGELFTRPGENGRVRASVRLKANGDSEIDVAVAEKAGR